MCSLITSAGTYVKEFIHSDLGRTLPSLCSLTNQQLDIIQLDVLDLFEQYDSSVDPEFDLKVSQFESKIN